MNKETKLETTEAVITEPKKEEGTKAAAEVPYRRRDAMSPKGRLYIDPKYQRPGRQLRVVNDTPGNIEYALSLGYRFITDSTKVGDGSLQNTNEAGSAVKIEVGKYHGSQKAYLMDCPIEHFQERRKEISSESEGALDSTIAANQRDDQKRL